MRDFTKHSHYMDALGVRIAIIEATLAASAVLRPIHASEVAALIQTHFNLDELDALVFELGVNGEEIGGHTITSRPFHLVEYCQRHGLVERLLETLRRKRPFVDW